jgi:hypothetical protein
MLASPTGSEMAARQQRFIDRVEADGLLTEVVTSPVRPPVLVLDIPRGWWRPRRVAGGWTGLKPRPRSAP